MALALLGAGIWQGVSYLRSAAFARLMAGGSAPVRSVYFETDGVLSEAWLNRQINLPSGIELMAVDIDAIQHGLSAAGQVRAAMVERVFPDTLRIQVQERQPALRLAVNDADGQKRLRLLSREGVVYTPQDYPREALEHLPFVHGITLRRKADGQFAPVAGMAPVADFLARARQLMPERYAAWKFVSLAGYDPAGESTVSRLQVTTEQGSQIFLSLNDPDAQLARLEAILAKLETQRRRVARIDLTMEDAVVKLADANPRGPSRFR